MSQPEPGEVSDFAGKGRYIRLCRRLRMILKCGPFVLAAIRLYQIIRDS